MKPALILITVGILIALAGILHDRSTAAEVRKLRAFHEHQANLQKIKDDAAARFREVDAKLATQKLLLERERDRKLAQIQEEREADELLQKKAALWK